MSNKCSGKRGEKQLLLVARHLKYTYTTTSIYCCECYYRLFSSPAQKATLPCELDPVYTSQWSSGYCKVRDKTLLGHMEEAREQQWRGSHGSLEKAMAQD